MPRKISRSILDDLPTLDAVLASGVDFEPQYWLHDEYPNLRSGISELGLYKGQRVTRADVFKLVDESPRLAVMLALVWGFPEATINGHRPPLEAIFGNAATIADRLKELRQLEPLPARKLIGELNDLCGKGASTSTTSKLAYFFGLEAREGACLIYDYRVIAAIMEGTFLEFLALRRILPTKPMRPSRDKTARLKSAQGRHTETYADYLSTAHRVAGRSSKQIGVHLEAHQIELRLWEGAPKSSVQSALTKKWKRKKRQSQSRAIKSRGI